MWKTLYKEILMKKYRIQKLIGNGTYGQIYQLCDCSNNLYAGKKLSTRKRFTYIEKEIIENLNHKNIIKYYDFFNRYEHIYLVLELGDDDIYNYFYKSKNYLSLHEIIKILYDIAQAIQYLHHKNIVHADIKIENILKCGNEYKLCDFSLSFDNCSFVKTCPYSYSELSYPEILDNKWGKPSDIWCFGLVINRLLFIYSYLKKHYLDTFDEIYYKLLQLKLLCLNKNYKTRINIEKVLKKIEDLLLISNGLY